MKVRELFDFTKRVVPHAYPEEVLTAWLNEVEGRVQTEVLLLQGEDLTCLCWPDNADTELLVKFPYDSLYWVYLAAMCAYTSGEMEDYNNHITTFNDRFCLYSAWYAMNYRPADGAAVEREYYLTAYSIALRHGFEGTEEAWLQSLKGDKGEPLRWEDLTEEQKAEVEAAAAEELKPLLDRKLNDTTHGCEVLADEYGFAVNDQTKAGWRSFAGGYLTEADNTSFAHGVAVLAHGKSAAGFGYGLVADYAAVPYLMRDAALDDDCIVTDKALAVGDFINLNPTTETGEFTISDTKIVVEEIATDTGYKYRLNAPFRAFNYDETNVVNGVIPAGAKVRKIVPNEAIGHSSFVAGRGNKATGEGASAGGILTTASGKASRASGYNTKATGECAVAEGKNTVAAGKNAKASGSNTKANGNNSTAEGDNCKTYASATHAGGYMCEAGAEDGSTGTTAFAHGHTCKAKANNSTAIGYFTIAGSTNQLVQGRYNVEDKANKYVHIVGGGSSESKRKNIYTLDWAGNAVFAGKITANGVDILAELGNVSTALDNIIAIQEALIGGSAV